LSGCGAVNPAHKHFILSAAVEKWLDRFERGGGGIGGIEKKVGRHPPSLQSGCNAEGESVSREDAKARR
jgi:hypothetical protein